MYIFIYLFIYLDLGVLAGHCHRAHRCRVLSLQGWTTFCLNMFMLEARNPSQSIARRAKKTWDLLVNMSPP